MENINNKVYLETMEGLLGNSPSRLRDLYKDHANQKFKDNPVLFYTELSFIWENLILNKGTITFIQYLKERSKRVKVSTMGNLFLQAVVDDITTDKRVDYNLFIQGISDRTEYINLKVVRSFGVELPKTGTEELVNLVKKNDEVTVMMILFLIAYYLQK